MQLTLKGRKLLTHLPSDSARSSHTRHLHSRSAPWGTGSSGREAPGQAVTRTAGCTRVPAGARPSPGLAERTWPHAPPPTWHPTQVHGETDQVTPRYTSAQTRLWGMCPQGAHTGRDPRASTELSPFQHEKKWTWVHIRSVLHVKTSSPYGKLQRPNASLTSPEMPPFEKQFQTSDEDQKQHLCGASGTLSPRPVFAVCLWVILEFQRWVPVPHCKCLF